MSWYRGGTATFTNGSNVVSGQGTAWLDAARKGDATGIPGIDADYEITAVNTNIEMIIDRNYEGTTAVATTYYVRPISRLWGLASALALTVSKLMERLTKSIGLHEAEGSTLLTFSTTTAEADPGDGLLRANNADLSAATELYISKLDIGSNSIAVRLLEFDDSDSTVKGTIQLSSAGPVQASWRVVSVSDEGDYIKITGSNHSGAAAFTDAAVLTLRNNRTGDKGAEGDIGPTGLTGDLVTDEEGTTAERSAYDDEAKGFTYYNTETELFSQKLSATNAHWGTGFSAGSSGGGGGGAAVTVRTIATGNVDIADELEEGDTVNGVVLVENDTVFLKFQTDKSENGFRTVPASGSASRHSEYATFDEHAGVIVTVQEGGQYKGHIFECISIKGGTLDTDDILFQNITRINKNHLNNTEFLAAQQGESVSADNGHAVDQWKLQLSGATASLSRVAFAPGQTEVPGDPKYYMKLDVTVGNNNCRAVQVIPNVALMQGDDGILGFWARGVNPAGGVVQVRMAQYFGSGGSPDADVVVDLVDLVLTSTWTFIKIPFAFPSVSGKTLGTAGGDALYLWFLQPAADAATDAWNIEFAEPKLEDGLISTPWQKEDDSEQLRIAQRRFRYVHSAPAHWNNSGSVWLDVSFPFPMDGDPEVSLVDGTPTFRNGGSSITAGTGALTSADFDENGGRVIITGFSGGTAGAGTSRHDPTSGPLLAIDVQP